MHSRTDDPASEVRVHPRVVGRHVRRDERAIATEDRKHVLSASVDPLSPQPFHLRNLGELLLTVVHPEDFRSGGMPDHPHRSHARLTNRNVKGS